MQKTETVDENYDGLIDKIILKISFASNPATIQNIKLMVFFNYILQV